MKIAYLCLSGIGDAIMQLPAIRLVREKYSEAEFDIITLSTAIEFIMKTEKVCDNIYVFNPSGSSFKEGISIWKLGKQKHYDISMLGFPAYRKEYHMFQYLLGAKKRLFHRFKSGGYWKEFHFLGTDSIVFDEAKHNTINNLKLLEKIDIHFASKDVFPKINISNSWKDIGQSYIKKLNIPINSKIIGIHPGGMNYPSAIMKRWGYKNYAELIKEICCRGDYVLIFSGPEDVDEIKELKKLLQGIDTIHFFEENLETSMTILSNINLLICNDNGFGHISASLGIETIGLWGPTNPTWTAPNNPCYTTIRKSNNTPWHRYELKRSIPNGAKSGMEEIEISDVIKKIYPEK